MPFNGSGAFTPPGASFPVVAGSVIDSTKHNAVINDIADGLSTCVTKDGQTTITADQPMGGYKHTGVANAAARNDYAALGQVQDSTATWAGTAGGTANAITLTVSPAITAYAAGQSFTYKSGASANTSTMTVAISGLSTKAIQKNGAAVASGNHPANMWFRITYDGTAFQLEQLAPTSAEITASLALKANLASPTFTGTVTTAALTATGAITPSQTAGIVGTTTNNEPNAGSVGEYISSSVTSASAVSLVTSTSKNVTSIALTAGDWLVCGGVSFVYGATTSITHIQGAVSQASNTLDADTKFSLPMAAFVPGALTPMGFHTAVTRVLLSAPATIYLVAYATFTVSTCSAFGTISARRFR